MNKDMANKWSRTAIFIHWISAISVFSLFGLGLWMVELTYYDDWYRTGPHIHKSVGLLLFFLTALRVIYMLTTSRPDKRGSNTEKAISAIVNISMYLLLFAIFISGYLISTGDGRGIDVFSWFTIPSAGELFEKQGDIAGDVHLFLAWTLIATVALHVAGAVKHHFIDKDDTLKRMLRR